MIKLRSFIVRIYLYKIIINKFNKNTKHAKNGENGIYYIPVGSPLYWR